MATIGDGGKVDGVIPHTQPTSAFSNISPAVHPPGELVRQGAEARIYAAPLFALASVAGGLGARCFVKERFVKQYRHPALDSALSLRRMRAEARQLLKCRQIGLSVPALLHIDLARRQLWLEEIVDTVALGDWLCELLSTDVTQTERVSYLQGMAKSLGAIIAKMHANNIIHGDLTTANILVQPKQPNCKFSDHSLYLIDFGLSSVRNRSALKVHDEEVAVDLYVLERALISSLSTKTREFGEADCPVKNLFSPEAFFASFLNEYTIAYANEVVIRRQLDPPKKQSKCIKPDAPPRSLTIEDGRNEVKGVMKMLKEVEARGRKRLMIG